MALNPIRQRGTKSQVARLLLVDRSAPGRWSKQHADFPAADADGKHDLFDCCEWFFRRKFEQELDSTLSIPGASDSPGLERYRQAKAAQEEIKLAQLRGEVIMLGDFEQIVPALFGPWREVAEHVKRLGQDEIFERIDDANQRVLAGLERLYAVEDADSAA